MSPFRPDIVDVWIFRVRDESGASGRGAGPAGRIEFLMLRRAQGDLVLPGLWQGVSGGLEPGESSIAAALRELSEETGFGPDSIEHLYHLDQINQFLGPAADGILTAAVFAARIKPDAEPVISHEHEAMRWVSVDEAMSLAVWPDYRESIKRVVENLLDPDRSIWFELTVDGDRVKP
jgi:8-oxo-dGTP pyrophosphatase MutT (NUDIX family)